MGFITDNLHLILTALFAVLGAFGGAMTIYGKIITALKESTDVGVAIDAAIKEIDKADDDKIWEKAEIEKIRKKFQLIKKELKEAKTAWLKVFNK